MEWVIAAEAIWFILPAYIANSSAVIVGGGAPVDFGKSFHGTRIFGDGKTWRGFFGGIFMGTAAGIIMNVVAPETFGDGIASPVIILSLTSGALLGDLLESFFKRRIGKDRGEKWLIADQMDFLLGALFLSFLTCIVLETLGVTSGNWFLSSFSAWHIAFLLVFTPLLHYTTNAVGYLAGLKEVPW